MYFICIYLYVHMYVQMHMVWGGSHLYWVSSTLSILFSQRVSLNLELVILARLASQ